MVFLTQRLSVCLTIDNLTLDVVAMHISMNLAQKSARHVLDLKALAQNLDVETTLPSNIIVLQQKNQLKVMTTIIRDIDSSPQDFIFYLERLSSLVVERYVRAKAC